MLNSLRTKRKLEFVDGSLKRPVNKPEEEEKVGHGEHYDHRMDL